MPIDNQIRDALSAAQLRANATQTRCIIVWHDNQIQLFTKRAIPWSAQLLEIVRPQRDCAQDQS